MSTTTWPEQNAVDAWLKKHDVNVSHEAALELKQAVTRFRVSRDERLNVAMKHVRELSKLCNLDIAD